MYGNIQWLPKLLKSRWWNSELWC